MTPDERAEKTMWQIKADLPGRAFNAAFQEVMRTRIAEAIRETSGDDQMRRALMGWWMAYQTEYVSLDDETAEWLIPLTKSVLGVTP